MNFSKCILPPLLFISQFAASAPSSKLTDKLHNTTSTGSSSQDNALSSNNDNEYKMDSFKSWDEATNNPEQAIEMQKNGSDSSVCDSQNGNNLLHKFTNSVVVVVPNNPLVQKAVKGLDFKVIASNSSPEVIQALQVFNKAFYRGPILENPNRTNEGGEEVLTTLHPTDELPTSQHLMAFSGEQDWHYHAGPRDLNIYAAKPFSIFAGGNLSGLEENEKVNFVEIKFPAGTMVQARFPKHFLHGFKGEDFCATSFHYTDREELKELEKKHNKSFSEDSKDLMPNLTTFLDKKNTNLIASFDYNNLDKSKTSNLASCLSF